MSRFGKRLRDARTMARFSRQELADKVGVTVGALSNWENENTNPSGRNRRRLMDILPALGGANGAQKKGRARLRGQPTSVPG